MKHVSILIALSFLSQVIFAQIPSLQDTALANRRKLQKLEISGKYVQWYDSTSHQLLPVAQGDTVQKITFDREGREIEVATPMDMRKGSSLPEYSVRHYYYDSLGNLTRSETETTVHHYRREIYFFYDSTNKLIREDRYKKKKGAMVQDEQIKFSYGENGKVKEKKTFNFQPDSGNFRAYTSVYYKYNDQEKEVSSYSYNWWAQDTLSMDTTIYDGSGNVIQHLEYECIENALTKKRTKQLSFRNEKEYDKQGNLVESKYFFRQGDNDSLVLVGDQKFIVEKGVLTGTSDLGTSTKLIYDSKGEYIIAEINYDARGIPVCKFIYFHTYYE